MRVLGIDVRRSLGTSLVAAAMVLGALAAPALAASPRLEVSGHHGPTTFQPGAAAAYSFDVANVGDAMAGEPITLDVQLPPGVTTRLHDSFGFGDTKSIGVFNPWDCGGEELVANASTLSCTLQEGQLGAGPGMQPGQSQFLYIYVQVDPAASGELIAEATASGVGVAPATGIESARSAPSSPGSGSPPAASWRMSSAPTGARSDGRAHTLSGLWPALT